MFTVEKRVFSEALCLVGFGTDFFSNVFEEKSFLVGFCGEADGDGHFSGSALTPLVQIRENPEFHDLVQRDMSNWLGCLLWHGLLQALACPGGRSSWADTNEDIARNKLETAYGACSGDVLREWVPAQGVEVDLIASRVPHFPNVWSDGSFVSDDLTCIASVALVFANISGSSWFRRRWGHLDMLPNDSEHGVEQCSLYSSFPGPLQTVQRAEMWEWWWWGRREGEGG